MYLVAKKEKEKKKTHNKMLICCRFVVIEKKGWTSCDLLELKVMIIQPLGDFWMLFQVTFLNEYQK